MRRDVISAERGQGGASGKRETGDGPGMGVVRHYGFLIISTRRAAREGERERRVVNG